MEILQTDIGEYDTEANAKTRSREIAPVYIQRMPGVLQNDQSGALKSVKENDRFRPEAATDSINSRHYMTVRY